MATFQSLLFIRCLLTMTNVSLPAGLCSCLKHYYLIDEPKTWHEALDYCKEKYNNLAIVNNVEDMERLIAAAGSSYEGRVWIGLYDQSEKWIWALNDWSLYGHNDWNFRNWRSGEPNDMRTHRLMCVVSRDGFWYDAYLRSTVRLCLQHHTDLTSVRNLTENEMIQQKVPSGTLSWIGLYRHVWIWRPDNSHSDFSYWVDEHPNPDQLYHFVRSALSWSKAWTYCRQQHSDLATVFDIEDVNRLVNTAQYSTGGFTERAWIGLHDNLTSWRWSFSDSGYYGDKEADYRNWGFDQPDNFLGEQMCVEMWGGGVWLDSKNQFSSNYLQLFD
uniref:C-type lectin domain-containing protein n=1 Tax=Lates calcarifer TaxID=8187 RepID=A0A4W6CDR9_LATCA